MESDPTFEVKGSSPAGYGRYHRRECENLGIQAKQSAKVRRCQLCWEHSSRFRRECPICHYWIAPSCRPMRCWSDEYNHCRSCRALIEILKHYRFKSQYCMTLGSAPRGEVFRVISYLDCPVGVQINVLIFLIPIKDFIQVLRTSRRATSS